MRSPIKGAVLSMAAIWILSLTSAMALAVGAAPQTSSAGVRAEPWQVLSSASTTVEAPGGGTVVFELRRLARAGDPARAVTTLLATGRALQAGVRYLVLVNGERLGELRADAAGRAELRVASGRYEAGWRAVPSEMLRDRTLAFLQLVRSDSGATAGGILYSRAAGRGSDGSGDHVFTDWTPLCGAAPEVFGGAAVYRDEEMQTFGLFAVGLEPGTSLALVVDGVALGEVQVDTGGCLWAAYSTNPEAAGCLPLPEELTPVDSIDVVQVLQENDEVLGGSFRQPCELEPPHPVEWGGFDLCPADAHAGAWGFFGWDRWEDGHEDAVVGAGGLEPGTEVTVAFDGSPVGARLVDGGGTLWVTFSSDPQGDELPLPEDVRPLSSVDRVSIEAGGDVLLSGGPDDPCDAWEPPVPVASDTTALCPLDPDTAAAGLAGWEQYGDGAEDLWIVGLAPLPGAPYDVMVDGVAIASVTTDQSGMFELYLSSDPETVGGDPLPEALRPVSGVDAVEIASPEGPVLAGSFSEPCDQGGWDPPVPDAQGSTPLCPPQPGFAWGFAVWETFSDPEVEAFVVSAELLEPDAPYELRVDGRLVGTYVADGNGALLLDFCSDPGTLGCSLPLPAELSPVTAMDAVEIVGADGATALAGTFSEPCSGMGADRARWSLHPAGVSSGPAVRWVSR